MRFNVLNFAPKLFLMLLKRTPPPCSGKFTFTKNICLFYCLFCLIYLIFLLILFNLYFTIWTSLSIRPSVRRGPDTICLYSHVQHPESGCYAHECIHFTSQARARVTSPIRVKLKISNCMYTIVYRLYTLPRKSFLTPSTHLRNQLLYFLFTSKTKVTSLCAGYIYIIETMASGEGVVKAWFS
jgi:hypothetical protein